MSTPYEAISPCISETPTKISRPTPKLDIKHVFSVKKSNRVTRPPRLATPGLPIAVSRILGRVSSKSSSALNEIRSPARTIQFQKKTDTLANVTHNENLVNQIETVVKTTPLAYKHVDMHKNNVDVQSRRKMALFKEPDIDSFRLYSAARRKKTRDFEKSTFMDQNFDVIEKLGEGHFGNVFKVRSKEDGKLFAIKVAREPYLGLKDRTDKLEEVRKHQMLPPHENCVKLHKSWEEFGILYQQFELCDHSLDKILVENAKSTRQIPEYLTWYYLVDLLLALKHLHSHNLIHMDIKPENIFVSSVNSKLNDTKLDFHVGQQCKLGDFGLTVDLNCQQRNEEVKPLHQKGTGGGDVKYMAREILNGEYSTSCDVFSLGISILELTTNLELPATGPLWYKLRDTRYKISDNSVGLPQETRDRLSDDLASVLDLMLEETKMGRVSVDALLKMRTIKRVQFKRNIFRKIHQLKCKVMQVLSYIIHKLVNFIYSPKQRNNMGYEKLSSTELPEKYPTEVDKVEITTPTATATTCDVDTTTSRYAVMSDSNFSDEEEDVIDQLHDGGLEDSSPIRKLADLDSSSSSPLYSLDFMSGDKARPEGNKSEGSVYVHSSSVEVTKKQLNFDAFDD